MASMTSPLFLQRPHIGLGFISPISSHVNTNTLVPTAGRAITIRKVNVDLLSKHQRFETSLRHGMYSFDLFSSTTNGDFTVSYEIVYSVVLGASQRV